MIKNRYFLHWDFSKLIEVYCCSVLIESSSNSFFFYFIQIFCNLWKQRKEQRLNLQIRFPLRLSKIQSVHRSLFIKTTLKIFLKILCKPGITIPSLQRTFIRTRQKSERNKKVMIVNFCSNINQVQKHEFSCEWIKGGYSWNS